MSKLSKTNVSLDAQEQALKQAYADLHREMVRYEKSTNYKRLSYKVFLLTNRAIGTAAYLDQTTRAVVNIWISIKCMEEREDDKQSN